MYLFPQWTLLNNRLAKNTADNDLQFLQKAAQVW